MQDHKNADRIEPKRVPWNKGKMIGAKPPLRPKHVWSIRTKLQIERRIRDLAMFNLAIDSKLRGCDVVALKVEDVAPSGYAVDRATVRQKKTGQPVRFELTEQTRQAVDDYVRAAAKKPGEFMFTGRRGSGRGITTRQYARLVSEWIASIGLGPHLFGTHSLRRTKATPDLPAHRQSACRAAPAWTYKDREHREIPRHRGRRRSCHSGTS
jgi:integrase